MFWVYIFNVVIKVITRDEEALNAERQIKGWSRRKKEALINKDWQALSTYAKRKKKYHCFPDLPPL